MRVAWLPLCLALLLSLGSAPARAATATVTVGADLAYRIAAGRLQTRLDQDLQLLRSIQSLVVTVEGLAPRAALAAALLGTSPDTAHLRDALQLRRPLQLPPDSVRGSARLSRPPLPPVEGVALVFLQAPDARRLGKVILRIGERYVPAHVGEILQLGGIPHRVRAIDADHALLEPVAGGAARRVHWSGSTIETAP